jgi:hypothetical protein
MSIFSSSMGNFYFANTVGFFCVVNHTALRYPKRGLIEYQTAPPDRHKIRPPVSRSAEAVEKVNLARDR